METTRPIWVTSLCDQRTPFVFITTTYSAPLARRIRSAAVCTGPFTDGSDVCRSSAMRGWAAVVCAIASARRMAWSSS